MNEPRSCRVDVTVLVLIIMSSTSKQKGIQVNLSHSFSQKKVYQHRSASGICVPLYPYCSPADIPEHIYMKP